MSPNHARRRRRALAAELRDGAALIMGNSHVQRSRDESFPFHQNAYFRYLTGMAEPDCALLMEFRNGRLVRDEILCRENNPLAELWEGRRTGPATTKTWGGYTHSRPIRDIEKAIRELSASHSALYYSLGESARIDQMVLDIVKERRLLNRTATTPLEKVVDPAPLLDRMRLVKSREELAAMRKAAQISGTAHVNAMAKARKAKRECEVEAELAAAYRSHGAVHAFRPIVACGINACTLHYTRNDGELDSGSLLLVDSGCQIDGYCSDVTRTYPIEGRFSEPQKEIYSIVLEAQARAIAEVRPGNEVDAPEKAARKVFAKRLAKLGLIERTKDIGRLYPHKIGHWLGIDVHDVGPYFDDRGKPLRFKPGMVTTIEPGLYLGKTKTIPTRYRGIGVRIEDNILVTATGNLNLTDDIPKAVDELERTLAKRS